VYGASQEFQPKETGMLRKTLILVAAASAVAVVATGAWAQITPSGAGGPGGATLNSGPSQRNINGRIAPSTTNSGKTMPSPGGTMNTGAGQRSNRGNVNDPNNPMNR
jgi:hypothetical protein